ncbi:hypothetical protein DFH09DRAFT_1140676 [Mycena vulgaris]|nr:hypothetical protein DFH09DRAFT_1140676 [Mycena vulgaris]
MSLNTLPADLLLNLPQYLDSIEDLYSLFSTCRTLYNTCADPDPNLVLRLAANSGRVFFRPHPHLLIAATARQVADWAVKDDDHRYLLEEAIQGGVGKLLELALRFAGLSMADIRKLYIFKSDVLNPLNRRLDLAAGPATGRPTTVCNDPETTLLSWVIYGELFHHSLELAYLPLPRYKPLSSIIRFKWFVYCMPDENSFNYMGVAKPQFFCDFVQEDDDRYQQLSMREAQDQLLNPATWDHALQASPLFELPTSKGFPLEWYISCVMHMGMKSLEILLPGGPERVREDLDRIASGIFDVADEEEVLEFVGDPWLSTAHVNLLSDIRFTLWNSWEYAEPDFDTAVLEKAIGAAPQKVAR